MIKTERLKIYPATREQMEEFIALQKDENLKAAYTEMLNGKRGQEGPRYVLRKKENEQGSRVKRASKMQIK